MDATQKYLLNILLEIDAMCKKYDIEYFIDYGTTLGAVRHEGFIPWDDDIDINMTEDNYYKFVEACKKELDPKKRVYGDNRVDRDFPGTFGRFIDVESMRLSSNFAFWKPICGQSIDVFYFLELPGDPVKKQEKIDLYFAYDEFANKSYRHFRYKTDKEMELYNKFKAMEKRIGREKTLQKIEAQLFHQHYDDCDTYVSVSARKYGPTSISPKYLYDSVYYADFEGHKLPISGHYAELLNYYYGDDWNIIPDVKKQHSKMSHTGITCADYVSDYMRLLDEKEIKEERYKAKEILVEEGYRIGKHLEGVHGKISKLVKLKLEKKIKEENIDVLSLTDASSKEKMAKLDDLFSFYYEKQLNPSVRYWENLIDIGNDNFYAAMYNMIYNRNNFTAASKILKVYKANGLELDERMQKLWNVVLKAREIKAQMVYKNYEKAEELIKEAVEKYPYSKEVKLYNMEINVINKDFDTAKKLIDEIKADDPDNDRCKKALGDIAFFNGDKETADKYYDDVMKNSNNGLLHLDIRKKRGEK